MIAVATGVTITLLAVPGLRAVLIAVAVTYILWLAYRIATASPLSQDLPTHGPPSLVPGIVLCVVNPKAWIAIAAVFSSARLATRPAIDAAVKIAVLSEMIILICGGWLLIGAVLAGWLRDPRRGRIVNVVLAVTLLAATALAVLE